MIQMINIIIKTSNLYYYFQYYRISLQDLLLLLTTDVKIK